MKIVQSNVVTNEKTRKMIQENATRARTGIRKAFHKIGKDLLQSSKEAIEGTTEKKTGRTYYINPNFKSKTLGKKLFGQQYKASLNFNARIAHVSSAPGQSPAKITGQLIKSIDFRVNGSTTLEYGANAIPIQTKLGTVLSKYPLYLEEGTKKMEARPYLGNSIEKNQRNATVHLETQIFQAIVKP